MGGDPNAVPSIPAIFWGSQSSRYALAGELLGEGGRPGRLVDEDPVAVRVDGPGHTVAVRGHR
jgi:hypothetical protein